MCDVMWHAQANSIVDVTYVTMYVHMFVRMYFVSSITDDIHVSSVWHNVLCAAEVTDCAMISTCGARVCVYMQ
jgi:hypothetical protein